MSSGEGFAGLVRGDVQELEWMSVNGWTVMVCEGEGEEEEKKKRG